MNVQVIYGILLLQYLTRTKAVKPSGQGNQGSSNRHRHTNLPGTPPAAEPFSHEEIGDSSLSSFRHGQSHNVGAHGQVVGEPIQEIYGQSRQSAQYQGSPVPMAQQHLGGASSGFITGGTGGAPAAPSTHHAYHVQPAVGQQQQQQFAPVLTEGKLPVSHMHGIAHTEFANGEQPAAASAALAPRRQNFKARRPVAHPPQVLRRQIVPLNVGTDKTDFKAVVQYLTGQNAGASGGQAFGIAAQAPMPTNFNTAADNPGQGIQGINFPDLQHHTLTTIVDHNQFQQGKQQHPYLMDEDRGKEIVEYEEYPLAPFPEQLGGRHEEYPLAPLPEQLGGRHEAYPLAPLPEQLGGRHEAYPLAPLPEQLGGRHEAYPLAPLPEQLGGRHEAYPWPPLPEQLGGRHEAYPLAPLPEQLGGRHEAYPWPPLPEQLGGRHEAYPLAPLPEQLGGRHEAYPWAPLPEQLGGRHEAYPLAPLPEQLGGRHEEYPLAPFPEQLGGRHEEYPLAPFPEQLGGRHEEYPLAPFPEQLGGRHEEYPWAPLPEQLGGRHEAYPWAPLPEQLGGGHETEAADHQAGGSQNAVTGLEPSALIGQFPSADSRGKGPAIFDPQGLGSKAHHHQQLPQQYFGIQRQDRTNTAELENELRNVQSELSLKENFKLRMEKEARTYGYTYAQIQKEIKSLQLREERIIKKIAHNAEAPVKQESTKITNPAGQFYVIDFENKKLQCKLCGIEIKYSTSGPSLETARQHLERSHAEELGIPKNEGNSGVNIGTRKRKSDPAWQHYDIDKENKKWKCKICGHEWKYAAERPHIDTARNHLANFHKNVMGIPEKEVNSGIDIGANKRKFPDS